MTTSSKQTLLAFAVAVLAGFAFGGCNCGPIKLPYGPDGTCTPGVDCPDLGTCAEATQPCSATVPCCDPLKQCGLTGACQDPVPPPQCIPESGACNTSGGGAACCTGLFCNASGSCARQQQVTCRAPGGACTLVSDCCNGNACVNQVCSTQRCRDVGQACASNPDCCTQICGADRLCQPVPSGSTSKVIGQACTHDNQCASYNCQGGVCVKSYNCQADNDVCLKNSDCCTNQCSVNGTGTGGYCIPFGGGCAVEGTPCGDSAPTNASNCCTRICVDYGTGQRVCAMGSGCKIEQTICTATAQCCGSFTAPEKPDVVCDPDGRCGKGTGCNAVGNRCSPGLLPDGGTVQTNAQNASSCCGALPGGQNAAKTCKVDRAGVPRCFGGQTAQCPDGYTGVSPCCIQVDDFCSFSDQCCDGRACLPRSSDGRLVCTTKSTCSGLGTTCDPAASPSPCCAGYGCLPTSEVTYACQIPTDGGTSCRANGSGCATASDCCSQICSGGLCQAPASCQQEKAACTADTDCCTGLSCVIQPGASSGTCEKNSCQSSGQTCSPTLSCCSGLSCVDGMGLSCTGTNPCSCQVILQ